MAASFVTWLEIRLDGGEWYELKRISPAEMDWIKRAEGSAPVIGPPAYFTQRHSGGLEFWPLPTAKVFDLRFGENA